MNVGKGYKAYIFMPYLGRNETKVKVTMEANKGTDLLCTQTKETLFLPGLWWFAKTPISANIIQLHYWGFLFQMEDTFKAIVKEPMPIRAERVCGGIGEIQISIETLIPSEFSSSFFF